MERRAYQKIASALKSSIDAGSVKPGSFLPTERELQIQFAASRTTVRRALAHLIQAGYAENVPNRGVVVGGQPKVPRMGTVALLHAGTYVERVLADRLAVSMRKDNLYLVPMGGRDDYPPAYALQTALDNQFSGAIVWPYKSFTDHEFMQMVSKQLPIVALDHGLEGADTDLVTLDHEGAAAEATEHLIRQGCRRIAVSGMLDSLEITHQRFRGYMHAMFANGLQPEPQNFAFIATSGHLTPNVSLLEARLRSNDAPDGILVLQEFLCPAVVETALRCGHSLPSDIKIAAIGDDIDLTVDGNGLTAVAFDWDAMADEAIRLLLLRIADPSRPVCTSTVPHRLIIRGLSGAPQSSWTPEPHLLGFRGDLPVPRSRYQYSSSWSVVGANQLNSQS
jgi:LacI family transcriptional regulator